MLDFIVLAPGNSEDVDI